MRTTACSRAMPSMPSIAVCLAALLVSWPLCGGAAARTRHSLPRRGVPSVPDADAVGLGILAPPTRLSTLLRTYGDASLAPARIRRGEAGDRPTRLAPRFTCASPTEPRAIPCADGGVVPGYGLAYTYNPAYVSSPLVNEGRRSPLLPPVTELFWAANGLINPSAP